MPPARVPLLYVRSGHFVSAQGKALAGDEAERAKRLFDAHQRLYLLDLDGQFNGVANLALLQGLERKRVFPWVDAGCRKPDDAMDVLFAGAEALTVQLRHMEPDAMTEVSEMSEADFYVAFTVGERGLEKGLRAKDALELVQRTTATGVVLYESERADFHAAENLAFDLRRGGVPTAWVVSPGSANADKARGSERFSIVIEPETAP